VNEVDYGSGWTPLIYVARNGNTDLVRIMLLAGASIDHTCNDGWTALMFAARYGYVETVEELLMHHADPHIVAMNSMDALHAARLSGDDMTIRLIVDALSRSWKYELYAVADGSSSSLILPAAHSGNVRAVLSLIQAGHDPNERGGGGWTPLILAASSGSDRAVEELLRAGSEVNARDRDGWTPLMFAASVGDMKSADLLLDAGANCMLLSGHGLVASDIAVGAGYTDLGMYIYCSCVCRGILVGDVESVLWMVKRGDNPNIVCANCGGYTPLILACIKSNESAVASLLSLGADPGLPEGDLWTPLMFASARGDIGVVSLLLEAGARVDDTTANGITAIDIARSREWWKTLQVLEAKLLADQLRYTEKSNPNSEYDFLEYQFRYDDQSSQDTSALSGCDENCRSVRPIYWRNIIDF